MVIKPPTASATVALATVRVLRLVVPALLVAALALLASAPAPLFAQDANQRLLEAKRRLEQSGQQTGDEVTIEAEGVATWYQDDAARSRAEGIEAAQRDAVEQASGVIIQTETQMRNFDLVSDEVLSASKGFIRSYDVVKEGRDGPFYNVTIRAVVVKKAFIDNFEGALENLYKRVGKPRIMLLVQEIETTKSATDFEIQTEQALGVVEKAIRKILLKQGFTFIDARTMPEATGTREDLLHAARTNKAELVMLGRGRVGASSMLQKFNVVEANVGLDVLRTDNGQVMASDIASGKGLHINEGTAVVTALQKAAEEITPRIMEQVTYQWLKEKNEGQRIEMVVKNASFGELLTFRRELGNTVKGVRTVRQKSFKGGVALLEVVSKDTPERLAESLFEASFDGYKFEIENVTPTTLTVVMVKP